jgi:hypothetical protein
MLKSNANPRLQWESQNIYSGLAGSKQLEKAQQRGLELLSKHHSTINSMEENGQKSKLRTLEPVNNSINEEIRSEYFDHSHLKDLQPIIPMKAPEKSQVHLSTSL